ncbi:MAG: 1-deoxy-D-xylulose-5-phosphate reductoisomerase [Rubrobacter sp.]|nr:1-deoxy-D-xylulose-5-phosphate reductoisomerase [Rubrobacter sp.]
MKRRLTILGSTGSIGLQALEVVRSYPGRFEVVGLSAKGNTSILREQVREFEPPYIALESGDIRTFEDLETKKLMGYGAAASLAEVPSDIVLNGIVGFAGLAATVAALKAGNTVALANKESLVVGGEWVMRLAKSTPIIPVDSEHSAIFQCLAGRIEGEVRELLLTASGGPFFGYTKEELRRIGPEDALKHPTWRMGPKITIDSATLMNKGLEAIEAHHLFDVPFDGIRIVVHRQSIVHGGVIFKDRAAILHAALPDMRIAIAHAILYPERIDVEDEPVGFKEATWTFEEPQQEVFRCLPLAAQAGKAGGAYPVALNAANEIAVEAFLDRRIQFLHIPDIVEEVLDVVPEFGAMDSMEVIKAVDRWARQVAEKAVLRGTQ